MLSEENEADVKRFRFIHPKSKASTYDVGRKMSQGRDGLSYNPCPWVLVGNVLASVSETGATSWATAVKHLYKSGHRDFTVFAGRHGIPLGGLVDAQGRIVPRGNDQAVNPQDDIATASRVMAETNNYPGINIKVGDIERLTGGDIPTLQSQIMSQINGGYIVVLAWCYSLHALKPGIAPKDYDARINTIAGMAPIADTSADWDRLGTYAKFEATDAALGLATKHSPD